MKFVIYNLFDAYTDAYNSHETSWALRSTIRKFESEYLTFHHTTQKMEVKRERYPYCVVLDFMVHYFKNEWRWDVDIKDTFDIYTKTIISLGSKSTLGSTTKKLEFEDDKKLDLVRTNVSFYYGPISKMAAPCIEPHPCTGIL